MMTKVFNIRVYGLWLNNGQVLVNEERFRDLLVRKFPGGGLEWGEGLRACLKREWMEELGIEIEVGEHVYTTDYFQPSAFDGSQIISVYYQVTAPFQPAITNLVTGERSYWMPISEIKPDTFTLPIDKLVGNWLVEQIANGKLQ
jgi:ADP-ribose pyrophosphatase YjhB (NUDIX family)